MSELQKRGKIFIEADDDIICEILNVAKYKLGKGVYIIDLAPELKGEI